MASPEPPEGILLSGATPREKPTQLQGPYPAPAPQAGRPRGGAARQRWAEVTRLCTLSLLCGCPVAVLAARHGIGLQKASTPCYLDPQILLSFNLFLLFPLNIQPLLQQLLPALLCVLPTSLLHSFHLLPSPIFSIPPLPPLDPAVLSLHSHFASTLTSQI